MIESIRNHPSVILKNCITTVVLFFFLSYVWAGDVKFMLLLLALALVVIFINVRAWMLTTISFMDDRIVVNKRTIFKNDKTVPYERLSAVNVVRGVFEKIFGTTTLQFNVNSGVNAAVPEVSICVKKDQAERIKAFVTMHMYDHDPVSEEKVKYEAIASFSPIQVIAHSILSQPTPSLLLGMFFLVYGIVGAVSDSIGSAAIMSTTLLLFVIQTIVPVFVQIIRYYDFKVYRDGDTIYLQHGLLTNYRSSFEIDKVNAFTIKRPFFARVFGLAYLETDVVGINAVSNDVTPTLCLVTREKELNEIIDRLIPEFVYQQDVIKQSDGADTLIFGKTALGIIITTIVAASVYIISSMDMYSDFWGSNPMLRTIFNATIVAVYAVVIVLLVAGWRSSLRNKGYAFCEDKLTFFIGVLDFQEVRIRYDCIQVLMTESGYFARRKGLSKCTVSMLSSSGMRTVKSGYFRTEMFDDIGEELLTRIRNGHYYGEKDSA